MENIVVDQKREYTAALQDYLRGAGETALQEAYAIGRKALEQGVGAMDISGIHHEALAEHLDQINPSSGDGKKRLLDLASKFLAECLSPFEMAQRGFQETIGALKSLNENLEAEVQQRARALGKSEDRYRSLIQTSPDGITVTDMQGRITLSNQQAALLHGFQSPEEEVGIDASQFVAPEDMERVREMSQRVVKMGFDQPIEYTLLKRDGTPVPVEARVTLLLDSEGKPDSFVGVIRDITHRKEVEETVLRKARQQAAVAALGQLALSELDIPQMMHETCKLVAETLDVEFCELLEILPDDEDGLILRDGVGWKEGSVGVTTVKARANSQAGYTLLSAAQVIVDDLPSETRFIPPALLSDHDILSGITVIIHSDGQPYGVLGAHTDYHRVFTIDESYFLQSMANTLAMAIKNRQLLEVEAERRKAAEKAYEERLRTLAIVNHELRTPLTSIKGFATTLLAEDVVWSPEDQLDFIRTISEEADKLSGLIEQILDVSRMEAGRMSLKSAVQPLSAIVGRVMSQLNAITGNHTLIMDIPDTLPPVMADEQRSGQVLVNLVENATKYSPPGTPITVSASVEGDFARISVSDQGQGITEEDLKKVFQPFFRSEKSAGSQVKGVGLGLYICQRLVEGQGGSIRIESHQGPGTTFVFTLPLAVASERKK